MIEIKPDKIIEKITNKKQAKNITMMKSGNLRV
jgi:hypothetical protein